MNEKKRRIPPVFKDLNWAPLDVPRFKSGEEEANWWDAHQDQAAALFERAAKSGLLTRGTIARNATTRQMTMRMPLEAIQRAREVAQRKGMPYQTYLRTLILEGLKRDEKAG